ncbi:hypothetical protein H6P81_012070 [Aristolochia fimbriata]|uniref:DUF1664 domain-containing protein n=1 Tax=Aristolochia fimbriata TaxID=158543 RepID=A0AAV7EAQ3_ARIFI|nr:hypothetical protein H6P81_012070 [Aristolochia fimbriata]
MALPLGKLTILIGAGLLGSVLTQEGRASKISNFVSGAVKIAFRHIKQDDSRGPTQQHNDSLLAQVSNLRQELQMLASSRSVTIVSGRGKGNSSFGMPVIIIAGGIVGYGFIWFKGWKISDMMFATRRSLADACNTVGKQLEQVYSSVSATRRALSARIENVNQNIDQFAAINSATRDEVAELVVDVESFCVDMASVKRVVQDLDTKISRIEKKQDNTNEGVIHLLKFTKEILPKEKFVKEKIQPVGIQASPSNSARPPLDPPKVVSTSRTLSLPPALEAPELPSPSSSETPKVSPSSGLKEVRGISSLLDCASSGSPVAEEPSNTSRSGNGELKSKELLQSTSKQTCPLFAPGGEYSSAVYTY